MAKFKLGPRAQRDLVAIYLHTANEWGFDQADSYTDLIESLCGELAEAPELAPSCDHLRKGYRQRRIKSHIIFFRITKQGIAVLRILHTSMDPRRHL